MKYRKFGSTGLEVSEVIFGGGAVGGILIDADDETRRKAIRLALDGGINWIDTAANYGNGRSETAIGWLLAELPAERRPYVSTKVRLETDRGDFEGQIERSLRKSLQRLRRESVELFQIHNSVADHPGPLRGTLTSEQMTGEVADAIDAVRRKGLTRHVGFTATGEADGLHRVIESGRYQSAQVYYNLLNPSAGRPVPAGWSAYDYRDLIGNAARHGVAVMVIRVLAAGVIATDERHGREGTVGLGGSVAADEQRMRKVVALLGPEHGSRSQVAIRYALENPGVSGVCVGMARLEHLELALGAVEMGPLPGDLKSALEGLVESDFGSAPG